MTIKRKDLIIDLAVGLLVVIFCYFNSHNPEFTVVHRILDGCFVAGVLLAGAGVILFCANKGAFNILGYGAKQGINLILPIFRNVDNEGETYYDYCVRKAEKEPKSFLPLLISGGVYLALSVVLLVIYLNT